MRMNKNSAELIHLIPDMRDGQTVVERRILAIMQLLGIFADCNFRHTSTIIGNVMQILSMGDVAIYTFLTRMTQPESSRYPLVDGSGNFGDFETAPDPMAYIKARLSNFAMGCIELVPDSKPEKTRRFIYDCAPPPHLLRSKLPLILLNGSHGIEGQSASRIPSHNLGEVVDTLVAKIENPKLDSKELMHYLKGPDFPNGGSIFDTQDLRNAYMTGAGFVTCRGSYSVEATNTIAIAALPYGIGRQSFTNDLNRLIADGTLSEIKSVKNQLKRSTRIVLRLFKDTDIDSFIEKLSRYTSFQITLQILILAFSENGLRLLFLEDLVQQFIELRVREFSKSLSRSDALDKLRDELFALKESQGDPRRTQVLQSADDYERSVYGIKEINDDANYVVILTIENGKLILFRVEVSNTFHQPQFDSCCFPLRTELPSAGKSDIFIGCSNGTYIRMHENQILTLSEVGSGSKVMHLENESFVTGFEVFEPSSNQFVLVVTCDGYAKRVRMEDFELRKPGESATLGAEIGAVNSVCCSILVNPGCKARAHTLSCHNFDFDVDDIPILKKSEFGQKLNELGAKDSIQFIKVLIDHGDDN